MKAILVSILVGIASNAAAQVPKYVNFIRQIQRPSGVVIQMDKGSNGLKLAASGTEISLEGIDGDGSLFELHTVKADLSASYLLASKFVGAYLPSGRITLSTLDPSTSELRTRVDQPIKGTVQVSGLSKDPAAPLRTREVNFTRHVQSYGTGNGENIDPSQASLVSQQTISNTLEKAFEYAVTSIPANPVAKARGEERFSLYTKSYINETGQTIPPSLITSATIKVWPMAGATITGISAKDKLRFQVPTLRFSYVDLYPGSVTYAQVYRGEQILGTTGTVIPGSMKVNTFEHPLTESIQPISNYQPIFDADGTWTLEVVTSTPFGLERLAWVTFEVDRTMKVNSTLTSVN